MRWLTLNVGVHRRPEAARRNAWLEALRVVLEKFTCFMDQSFL